MTIEYAVKFDKTNAFFDEPEAVQFLAVHADPAIPFRKMQSFPAAYAMLVQRDGGEWEPVNGLDLRCIGMRAKHDIIMKRGAGWARCTCGWTDEHSYTTGWASYDFEAAAARHMTEVDARIEEFRGLMRYIPHTPEQEACQHANDMTRDDYYNPGRKEWNCKDCGLRVQYIADFERMW